MRFTSQTGLASECALLRGCSRKDCTKQVPMWVVVDTKRGCTSCLLWVFCEHGTSFLYTMLSAFACWVAPHKQSARPFHAMCKDTARTRC